MDHRMDPAANPPRDPLEESSVAKIARENEKALRGCADAADENIKAGEELKRAQTKSGKVRLREKKK